MLLGRLLDAVVVMNHPARVGTMGGRRF